MGRLRGDEVGEKGPDQGAQQGLELSQEQVEVVAGGGQDGVGAVDVRALDAVSVHAVLGLHVADHRLDSNTALPLPADGPREPLPYSS